MRHTTALYLTLLPSRAGHSAVMDACVHALAAIARLYYETTMNKGLALEEIAELDEYDRVLCLYNRALKFLRQALDDPDESVSSETLCATELLCCFEVCMDWVSLPLVWRWNDELTEWCSLSI